MAENKFPIQGYRIVLAWLAGRPVALLWWLVAE